MVFGISQEMLERARKIGEHFTLEVRNYKGSGRIELNLVPKDDWGGSQLMVFKENLMTQLCSQFYTYFGIQGEIIDVE